MPGKLPALRILSLLSNTTQIINMAKCVPFLRVADIAQTITWYERIGFNCTATNLIWEPDCAINWAEMSWGEATFMLYLCLHENMSTEKDAGLYFELDTIDGIADRLPGVADIIEITKKTFYGREEVVFKDLNGFMITFSCEAGKE